MIAGLGWLSVTGPGPDPFMIKVTVPRGTTVRMRDPIMPFEAKATTARHTGGRFVRKSAKQHKKPHSKMRRSDTPLGI